MIFHFKKFLKSIVLNLVSFFYSILLIISFQFFSSLYQLSSYTKESIHWGCYSTNAVLVLHKILNLILHFTLSIEYVCTFFVDFLRNCELTLLRILKILIIITQRIWFIVIIYRRIIRNIILLLQPNQDRNQPNQACNQSNQDRNQPNQDRNQPNQDGIQPNQDGNQPNQDRNQTHNQPTPTHYESELRRSRRVIKTPKISGESV